MKITDQERKAFDNLAKTDSGKILTAYCKKLVDFVYDSRNWNEGDDRKSADLAARVIQKHLVDKLQTQKPNKIIDNNQWS